MKIEYLKEFSLLAENLNFTETAKKCYLTQPGLSKHISKLEQAFGVPLFIRTTHNVELTQEGKVLAAKVKVILDQYAELAQIAKGLAERKEGYLRIGVLYYAVPEYVEPLLTFFQQEYPNIHIEPVSGQPQQVYSLLEEGTIDACMYMKISNENENKFEVISLQEELYAICVDRNSPLANRGHISLEELMDYTYVTLESEHEWNRQMEIALTQRGVEFRDRYSTAQVDLLPFALKKTGGFSIMPELLHNMHHPNLVLLTLDDVRFAYEMVIMYNKDNRNPMIPILANSVKNHLEKMFSAE